jgi:hypothetical protein
MKLQIRVDEHGVISDVKFKTFGCGSAIASSSYMTERVKGLSLEDAEKIKNTDIAKELCLPPVKLHCSSAFYLLLHPYALADAVCQCSPRTPSARPSVTTAASGRRRATRQRLVTSTLPSRPPRARQQHRRTPLRRYGYLFVSCSVVYLLLLYCSRFGPMVRSHCCGPCTKLVMNMHI